MDLKKFADFVAFGAASELCGLKLLQQQGSHQHSSSSSSGVGQSLHVYSLQCVQRALEEMLHSVLVGGDTRTELQHRTCTELLHKIQTAIQQFGPSPLEPLQGEGIKLC